MLRVDVVKRQGVSESDELIDCGMVVWSFDGGTCEVALPVLDLEKVRNVLEKQKTDKERKDELFSLWSVHQEKIELYLESAKAVADACKAYSVNRSGFADTYAKDDHWEMVSHDAVDLEVTHASDISLYHALDMVVNLQCKPKEEYQVWVMPEDEDKKGSVRVNITLKDGSTLKNCEVMSGTSFIGAEPVTSKLELVDWFTVQPSVKQERVIKIRTQSPAVVLELEIKPSMVDSWEFYKGEGQESNRVLVADILPAGSIWIKNCIVYKQLENGTKKSVRDINELERIFANKHKDAANQGVYVETEDEGLIKINPGVVIRKNFKWVNREDWMGSEI
ncbi:hypothetical protein ACTFR8_23270 [Bacillus cereus group sp. MYBK15-3]|uniref:hypothetical protein n=1 Tax=Bacillus cereus group TaxID=86661 RepID=UPI001C8B9F1F|nr:hypothetical protein [Bacillus cereus]MBX9158520.1 hypothetical protein [Bacillus cereus]